MKPKQCLFLFLISSKISFGYPALVTVPVIDLISIPASKLCPEKTPIEYYNQIPLAATDARKDHNSCPRQHQALFHEVVEVIEEGKLEAKVKISSAYYLNLATGQRVGNFWTLKENLIPLSKLPDALKFLPTPINFLKPETANAPNTITLIRPWRNWSVGTRFLLNLTEPTSSRYHQTYCYQDGELVKLKVPKRAARISLALSTTELRSEFVKLVEIWTAKHRRLAIPYVWGGCSYIQRLPMLTTKVIDRPGCDKELNYYQVPSNLSTVQTGFDCSGLVLRAAQAAGLPYFYKNTATLLHELSQISESDPVLPGDLIWIQGHVIIIIDPAAGLCVEARDYGHGYGYVQQIRLDQLFKETETIQDLKNAHLNQKSISRLDKSGQVVGTYQVKLLKLID